MSDSAPIGDEVLEPPVDALRQLCYANPDFAKRYEGWEVIGHGAFATVVRVSLMGQPVALKIFTNLNEEGKARFRSEFASTVRLTSPFVVRTYSAFENRSIAWLEMEAVEGPNLEDELARRERENDPFPLGEALDIAIAVATVVVQAHEQGIVHRDIKPANILLPRSRKPLAKLGDFGIARFMDAAKLTATGGFPGTPKWAAPEVFALKPQVGPPADVYSLSLSIFALFTANRYPWVLGEDVSPGGFMAAHLKNRPLRMTFFERGLSQDLDDIVASGLEKRPHGRPTALDVMDALSSYRSRHAARHAALESADPGAQARLRRLPRVPMLTLAGALALVVLAWTLRSGRTDQHGGPAAVVLTDPGRAPASSAGASVDERPHDVRAAQANTLGNAEVRVSARSGFIRIQNGDHRLSEVAIVLVGADGRRHAYRLPGDLSPFESAEIASEAFSPPATREPLREARISAAGPVGRTEARVPIDLDPL